MPHKQLTVFCLSLVFLFSCSEERHDNFSIGEPVIVHIEKQSKAPSDLSFSFAGLDLYQDINSVNHRQFKKYGTFYTRDFTIYQINNLDLLEDNLYITEIYLYFIDNTLHKIQAFTTKNMSDFFLSKYRGTKLVLKDRFNKEIVKNEGALKRIAGKNTINSNLNNYKLKWKLTDRQISYLVDESAQKSFEALEELIDLENQQKIKAAPKYVFTIESNEYAKLLNRVKYDEAVASLP